MVVFPYCGLCSLHNSCREHKPLLRPIKVYRYVLVINCFYRSCAKRFMRQHTADLNTRKINFRGVFYRILRLCQYVFRLLRNCLCYRLRSNDGLLICKTSFCGFFFMGTEQSVTHLRHHLRKR